MVSAPLSSERVSATTTVSPSSHCSIVSSSAPLANVQMRRSSWFVALVWTTYGPPWFTHESTAQRVPKVQCEHEYCCPETVFPRRTTRFLRKARSLTGHGDCRGMRQEPC